MRASEAERERQTLRDLLIGGEVLSIEPPDAGVHECLAKFVVRRGGRTHEFHLHATDLGWWVGEHQSSTIDADGNLLGVYEDFDALVEAVFDHLNSDMFDEDDSEIPTLQGLSDSTGIRVGFRCQVSGKEWWARLSTVKQHPAQHIQIAMSTPEGRAFLAEYLGTHFRLPNLEEMSP